MKTEHKESFSELEAAALRQKLGAAVEAQTKSTIALGALLYDACYGTVRKGNEDIPMVLAWGHDDFDEFAEHELGVHQTTARGLVLMYEELVIRRDIDEGTIAKIRITKLRQLARASKRVPDGRGFNSWVSKAIELSCCEFEEAVETEFGSDRKFKPLGFRLKLSKYSTFMRKMRSAREMLEAPSNGEALSLVLDEWYERHQGAKTGKVQPIKRPA